MRSDLQQKLFDTYKEIFADVELGPQESLMCFGIETGDGWYTLLDTLCSSIQHDLDTCQKGEVRQVKAVQVKEKFGGLRFYYTGGHARIRGMVDLAEALSYRTCDVCGAPGKPNNSGWVRTRCKEHTGPLKDGI